MAKFIYVRLEDKFLEDPPPGYDASYDPFVVNGVELTRILNTPGGEYAMATNFVYDPSEPAFSGDYLIRNIAGITYTEPHDYGFYNLPNGTKVTRWVQFIVDDSFQIPSEYSEPAKRPDLTDTVVDVITRNIAVSDKVQVVHRLQNIGTGDAQGQKFGFYLSVDHQIDKSDMFLGELTTGFISSGSKQSYTTTTLPTPADLPSGIYYIGVIADYNNSVAESDETNNVSGIGQVFITNRDPDNIDYAAILPDTKPPADMDWASDEVSTARSEKLMFDEESNRWVLDLGTLNNGFEWFHDTVIERAIAKVTGGFWETADGFIDAAGNRLGLPLLYQKVQDSKKLYDATTNFYTKIFDNISDVLDGSIDYDEFRERYDNATLTYVDDTMGVSERIVEVVNDFEAGVSETAVDDSGNDDMRMSAGGQSVSDLTFAFSAGVGSFAGSSGKDGLVGGDRSDKINGRNGSDFIFGAKGNDHIQGAGGNDKIMGGEGSDVMNGGKGGDIYIFNAVKDATHRDGPDVVYFDQQGRDSIDLSDIDANSKKRGDQFFEWTDPDNVGFEFNDTPAQLRFSARMLSGDVDGDGRADFKIKIIGSVSAEDILL